MANRKSTSVTAAVGAAFIASAALAPLASAAENPFQAAELSSGYQLAAHHGEGKCGEGRCGEDKKAKHKDKDHDRKAKKDREGKCGEGRCGEEKEGDDDAGPVVTDDN